VRCADYRLDSVQGIGAALLADAEQTLRGDESNQLAPVDGYAVVNLRGAYPVNRHLGRFARVANLFDTDSENLRLPGEDPGEEIPGLNNTSPRFLGVGAPRAGWVGVRLKL